MSNHQQHPNHPAPRFQVRQSSHPGFWEAYDTTQPHRLLMKATLNQQEAYAEAERLNRLPVKKSNKTTLIVVGSIVGGLALLGIIGSFLPDNTVQTAEDGQLPGTFPTSTAVPSPVVTPTPTPTKPAPVKTTAPKPVKTTAAPKPKPIVYKKLTRREWAKIAKSPDSHAGEAYTVYGVVTQFDSATGDDQFRADVDGVKHTPSYGFVDYPTNTLMTNVSGDLSDLVQDDLFTAQVIVLGSFSYDTQIGGETTVPQLSIASIKVTGSVK